MNFDEKSLVTMFARGERVEQAKAGESSPTREGKKGSGIIRGNLYLH